MLCIPVFNVVIITSISSAGIEFTHVMILKFCPTGATCLTDYPEIWHTDVDMSLFDDFRSKNTENREICTLLSPLWASPVTPLGRDPCLISIKFIAGFPSV